MSIENLDLNVVRKAANENPKYRAVLELHAARRRGRQDSTVSRSLRLLREGGLDVNKEDLMGYYRVMQDAGAGRWIAGRHGKEGRFVWAVHLVSLARAVLNAKATAKDVDAAAKPKVRLPKLVMTDVVPTNVPPKARTTETNTATEEQMVKVKTAGFEFEFPRDVFSNPTEAAEIKAFLRDIAEHR